MNHAAISIRNVSKSFGQTRAVRDLDLEIPTGSVCGFLGPNGAGKSTTIRMIMSIIYPDSGSIEVLGRDAIHNKDRIGYLPEERGLYRKMRVGEFLEYIARLKGARVSNLSEHVRAWLERVDLPDVYGRRCQELSKGMQQKVQFVTAIIHNPELIILDEPFSGLDPVNAVIINELINELRSDGRTIVFSTHILHQAEKICDRIFLINRGEKLLDATLDEIRARFDPRTIVAEPMNGSISAGDISGVVATHELGDRRGVEIEIAEDADPQSVIREIVASQPVRSIELRRLSLEDVFVQLVLRDAGAAAAARVREELSHA